MRRPSFIASLVSIAAGLLGCVSGKRTASSASSPSSTSGMMGSMMSGGSGMMGSGSMGMMNVSQHDMSVYMEMFNNHRELRRRVTRLPNGIQSVTESDNPRLVALLQQHVPSMYGHVEQGNEVLCMSNSLPTMFRNPTKYSRHFEMTHSGISVTETTDDPEVLAAILRHADEVSGFVRDGMPAMMRGMMGS